MPGAGLAEEPQPARTTTTINAVSENNLTDFIFCLPKKL
jgi:hypothetical protein